MEKTVTAYKCAECGKITTGRKPRHGDGTFYYPRRHKGANGEPCAGNIEKAEQVEVPGGYLYDQVKGKAYLRISKK